MKNSVYFFIIVFSNIGDYATAFPYPDSDYKEAVDCRWTDWIDEKCVLTNENIPRRREARLKKLGQNGGKDCEGSAEKLDKPCSEAEYMAQVFINTFTQSEKPPPGEEQIKKECTTPRADSTNRWRMSGRGVGCQKGVLAAKLSSPFPAPEWEPEPSPPSAPEWAPAPAPEWFPYYRPMSTAREKRDLEHSSKIDKPYGNQIVEGDQALDILFLVDESISVGEDGFEKEMRFMKETIKKLCGEIEISPNKTRVGLTTFDMAVHDLIRFKESTDINGILERLDDVRYNSNKSEGKCLQNALIHVRESVFTKESGARYTGDVYDLVVLVTDGCANCPRGIEHEVQRFGDEGITLILVAISDKSFCSLTISQLAYGNHCFLNYEIADWDDFDDFVDEIKNIDCQNQWKVPDASCP